MNIKEKSQQLLQAVKDNNLKLLSQILEPTTQLEKIQLVGVFDISYFEMMENACCEGKIEIVKYLIEKEWIEVNQNETAFLMMAIRNKQKEVAQYLIEKGAFVDAQKGEAISLAIIADDLLMVKLLINSGFKINSFNGLALRESADYGKTEITQYLLEQGADVSNSYPLRSSIGSNYLEITKLLIKAGSDISAFKQYDEKMHEAVINNGRMKEMDTIKFLVNEYQYDLNQGKETILEVATQSGKEDTVIYLIEKNVDITKNNYLAVKNLIRKKNISLLKLLLETRKSEKEYQDLSEKILTDINDKNKEDFAFIVSYINSKKLTKKLNKELSFDDKNNISKAKI